MPIDCAFDACNKLVEVINKSSLPIKKVSVEYGAVAWNALIVHSGESKIVDKNDFLFITDSGTHYLLGYTGKEKNLVLPNDYEGAKYQIYQSAFSGCKNLTSVTIGSNVTSIGDSAFNGCKNLTSVTIGNGVISIGYAAFNGCSSLRYNVYDNAYYLGNESNQYLWLISGKDTETCIINENCKYILGSAFYGCGSLTSIIIPNSVTSIGSSAFNGCKNLTSVTIGNGVISIEYATFYNCDNLTNVTIGNGVTAIRFNAFNGCGSLTSIIIPNSVTSIGIYAFYNCSKLTSVYYKGTESDWNKISIFQPNGVLTNTTRYYYSETKPTTTGNYWRYVDGVPTPWEN